MTPWQLWKLYRKVNKVAEQMQAANETKTLWKSRTFWFNILTGAAEVAQYAGGLNLVPPGVLGIAGAVINIGLRLVTDKPIAAR